MKLLGMMGLMFLALSGFCQDMDTDEKYTGFEVIKILDTGDKVIGRVLTADEIKKISFSPVSEISTIQVEPELYFRLVNGVVYLDWQIFATEENTLGVVNPLQFKGEVLAITPESLIYLLSQNCVYFALEGAEQYFKFIEFYDEPQRTIDPAACANPEHGSGAPHRVEEHNVDSDCHGSADDEGYCTNIGADKVNYSVRCFVRFSPSGDNRSYCIATISCADGLTGTGVGGGSSHSLVCRTSFPGETATAGHNGDVGYIECGRTRDSLDCSR